ncbi:protein phosphatase 2C domain-containing protein [Spongiactinospora sp. TRM90649]|uniref:PP2C family protein-serine/threonine phosphatase n=1 Tax=Spongiactinospora sp. TRM90649 TaxID=3031114 RepID=UPI0023F70139|nr:protein phosphatase 2C domain-containing protein [Spongiactinospora sp. TRM90649]MDF5753203.1 protein phosphatase 2C domain-containing protein [Spongiactinospora sp. TRM90649]
MAHTLRYAAASDVGRRREQNEDSAYASPRVLAVADGMGGYAHGEVASTVAITAVAAMDGGLPTDGVDLHATMRTLVKEVNHTIGEMTENDPGLRGMGTTLTAMLWEGGNFALAHIGDSRAYLLRDGALYQITHDHTLVQTLVDDGRITPEQASVHPRRSMLLRVLEGTGDGDPDVRVREGEPGDRYLLCSDGLTAVVGPDTLHEVMSGLDDLAEVAARLIELANEGGGPDNISCVVADFVEVPDSEVYDLTGVTVGAAAAARPPA